MRPRKHPFFHNEPGRFAAWLIMNLFNLFPNCGIIAYMQDIHTSEDITRLVHTFYERVGQDEMLSPAFNKVAQVDWETHLPKMVGFWETLLLKQPNYKGNPPLAHQQLREKMQAQDEPLTLAHFNHWIDLFKQTVDDLFAGPTADAAKRHAYQIGRGLTVHLFDMTAWRKE